MNRVLALALLAACDGTEGLVSVSLTTAPGSTLLDGVESLRMELTNPNKVVTAERTSAGFDLAIELPASGTLAALLVDGFDASGNLVATGASPRFAVGGVDGRIVIYMAEPDSVAIAPEALDPARSELGVGILPYGAIFVGGRTVAGASGAVEIYNAFDHRLISGLPLPNARVAPAVAVGAVGVSIFGGLDAAGVATATLLRFDPSFAPSGSYLTIGDKAGFERAGETLVPLGAEQYLVTGTPAAELAALAGSIEARTDIASLPPVAVSVTGNDGTDAVIFVGDTTILRYRGGQFDTLATPGRPDGAAVAVAGGKIVVVCGSAGAVRIDAATGTAETVAAVPSATKTGCAVAATERHLLIAGGTSAAGVDASVEVFDTATLTPLVTATLAVPRTRAVAVALANGQIMIAGGVDAAGAPVATIELFTPAR